MIPTGGCPLSPQTDKHLLLREGSARAVGFKAPESGVEVWDRLPHRLQKAGGAREEQAYCLHWAWHPHSPGEQGELDFFFFFNFIVVQVQFSAFSPQDLIL